MRRMAVPERAWALQKFSAFGLSEPFIANLCGKWLGLRLNGCFAALADSGKVDWLEVNAQNWKLKRTAAESGRYASSKPK